jgi:3-isopropylmalate/(R)-2-methylmalate dehydratase small subunit
MEAFRNLEAAALPLPQPNIDTDQIIPARFLRKPRSKDYGRYLFHDLRFRSDGSELLEFLLNAPLYRQSRIIVAADNFGCGSSRENAVWALYDYGFRAAIAPSFGDIFAANCLKNGFLTITFPPELTSRTLATLLAVPGTRIAIDLAAQTLTLPGGGVSDFKLDPFTKRCLMEGNDELGFTLTQLDRIIAFEGNQDRRSPTGAVQTR